VATGIPWLYAGGFRLPGAEPIKDTMEKLTVSADMGCVKIYTRDLSLFINNGFGDGMHHLYICTNLDPNFFSYYLSKSAKHCYKG